MTKDIWGSPSTTLSYIVTHRGLIEYLTIELFEQTIQIVLEFIHKPAFLGLNGLLVKYPCFPMSGENSKESGRYINRIMYALLKF